MRPIQPEIKLKRIYEPVGTSDGFRVLVDRLWPRGISKEAAQLDYWAKAIAPSNELRKWLHDDIARWASFQGKYKAALQTSEAYYDFKAIIEAQELVTFLFAAKDEAHNNAVVLMAMLQS